MTDKPTEAPSSGGPDLVVGLLLVIAALVFSSQYGDGRMMIIDSLGNQTDLFPPAAFLVWTVALATVARATLKLTWPRLARWFRERPGR